MVAWVYKMKVFIWIGYKIGGYEQRTLSFARFLKENFSNVDITLGFFESKHEEFVDFELYPLD